MKLKNLAVLLIAAVMTVMLYMIGATVFSQEDVIEDPHEEHEEWTALASNGANYSGSGKYYLSTNITYNNWTIPSGDKVELCLNGKTLNGNIIVSENAELKIYDYGGDGIITGTSQSSTTPSTITVNSGGTVYINGGTISTYRGSRSEKYYPIDNRGTLKINDEEETFVERVKITGGYLGIYNTGELTANHCDPTEGVQIGGGSAELNDVNIDSQSNCGIGVTGAAQTVTIRNSTIKDRGTSGAIETNYSGVTVYIYSSTITGNRYGIKDLAGALSIYDTTITCTYTSTSLESYGIHNQGNTGQGTDHVINIDGCSISGNSRMFTAIYNEGGNVTITSDTNNVNITSGTSQPGILNNSVANNGTSGKATINETTGKVTISGLTGINNTTAGCEATVNGGTIIGTGTSNSSCAINNAFGATVRVSGGTVGNSTTTNGIYCLSTVNVSGGTIIGKTYGINAYESGSSSEVGSSVTVSGNDTKIEGGTAGIYFNPRGNGNLTVSGGTITGGTNGIRFDSTFNFYLSGDTDIVSTQYKAANSSGIADIYLKHDATININGELTHTNGDSGEADPYTYSVFVSNLKESSYPFTSSGNTDNNKREQFESAVLEYTVRKSGATGQLLLYKSTVVTFDYNGNTNNSDTYPISYNDEPSRTVVFYEPGDGDNETYGAIKSLPAPKKVEYTFLGWYYIYTDSGEYNNWLNTSGGNEILAALGSEREQEYRANKWRPVTDETQIITGENHVLHAEWTEGCLHMDKQNSGQDLPYDRQDIWSYVDQGDNEHHKCICIYCNKTVENIEHVITQDPVVVDSTCTRTGTKTYTCDLCSGKKVDTIEKKNHTPGGWEDKGYTEKHVKICSMCNQEVESQPHQRGNTWAAHEPDDGKHYQYCSTCHHEFSEGHKTKEKEGNDSPYEWTPNGDAEHIQECYICRATVHEHHMWDGGKVIKQPDSDKKENGTMLYTCTKCGLTKENDIPYEDKGDGSESSSSSSSNPGGGDNTSSDGGGGTTSDPVTVPGGGEDPEESDSSDKEKDPVESDDSSVSEKDPEESSDNSGSESSNSSSSSSGGGDDNGDGGDGDDDGTSTSTPSSEDEEPGGTLPPGGSTTNPPPGPGGDGDDDDNKDPGTTPSNPSESQAGNGTVVVRVEVAEGAPDASISSDSSKKLGEEGLQKQITAEQRETVLSGGRLEIILKIANLEMTSEKAAEDVKLTQELVKELSYVDGMYLDVEIIKLLNSSPLGNITNLENPIRITFEIPEELKKENRSFSMVRVHEGTAEMMTDWDNDPDTLTILSDKFSTYVIVYKDNANGGTGDDNPYTGAGQVTGLAVMVLVCTLGTAAAYVMQKKKN